MLSQVLGHLNSTLSNRPPLPTPSCSTHSSAQIIDMVTWTIIPGEFEIDPGSQKGICLRSARSHPTRSDLLLKTIQSVEKGR